MRNVYKESDCLTENKNIRCQYVKNHKIYKQRSRAKNVKECSISSNSYRKVLITFKYKEIMCFLEKPLTKKNYDNKLPKDTNYQ